MEVQFCAVYSPAVQSYAVQYSEVHINLPFNPLYTSASALFVVVMAGTIL